MHYEFKLAIGAIDSQYKEDFNAIEIDSFLNQAIILYIRETFNLDPQVRAGFETDSETIAALSPLHVESPQIQPGLEPTALEDVYAVNLSRLKEDYWYLTKVVINAKPASNSNCAERAIEAQYKRIDKLQDRYSAPSYKWKRAPFRIGRAPDGGSAVFIFNHDEFTISTVEISYIKRPNIVFISGYNHIDGIYSLTDPKVNCDLPQEYHDQIVELAVYLALRSIGDPRSQNFAKDILSNKTKIN